MHEAIKGRLSEYLDEELSADERKMVEDHLGSCARCRSDLALLRKVVARARVLRDAPPEADLWPGVAARIGDLDGTRTGRRFSFTLPQLIAAGLALMVLSGGMVWLARLGGPRTDFPPVEAVDGDRSSGSPTFADTAYDTAIADLERTLGANRTRLDRETLRVLDDNLRAIDQALDQCRDALEADPSNLYLNRHLSGTRARKLQLLRHAVAIADRRL